MPVPLIVAGAAAAVGTVGKAIAGGAEADAQRRLAMTQQGAAQHERELALQAAEPSVGELQAMQRQLEVADRAVARQEKLLEAIDPALIESGKQALQLLRGQEAASLGPLRRQRAQQRSILENRLREQLGPGFETSSAGIEALSRFDQDTADTLSGAQERTAQSFLSFAGQIRPDQGQLVGLGGVGAQQQAGLAQRRLGALESTRAGILGTVGGRERGDIAGARATGDIFGGIQSLGGIGLGAALPGALAPPGVPSISDTVRGTVLDATSAMGSTRFGGLQQTGLPRFA